MQAEHQTFVGDDTWSLLYLGDSLKAWHDNRKIKRGAKESLLLLSHYLLFNRSNECAHHSLRHIPAVPANASVSKSIAFTSNAFGRVTRLYWQNEARSLPKSLSLIWRSYSEDDSIKAYLDRFDQQALLNVDARPNDLLVNDEYLSRFYRAYSDASVLARLFECGTPEFQSIANALIDLATGSGAR
ncbi:MAG: hypothetical protein OIF51_21270, partial [Cellvibrionaceae bacterium]|nr:hypothetical protein [Cellvibrionaceae bacterium]